MCYIVRYIVSLWIVVLCHFGHAKGQDYYFNNGKAVPSQNDFLGSHEVDPRTNYQTFNSFSPFIPNHDLQTSDIPFPLQQTLPQYQNDKTRYNQAFPQEFKRDYITPSTHRPNYAHLLNRNKFHGLNRDFLLNEEKVQNLPAHAHAEYNQFIKPSVSNNQFKPILPNIQESKLNSAYQVHQDFLNHRTRVFAPDNSHNPQNKTEVNEYYVNNNGQVYVTTEDSRKEKPEPQKIIREEEEYDDDGEEEEEIEDSESDENSKDYLLNEDNNPVEDNETTVDKLSDQETDDLTTMLPIMQHKAMQDVINSVLKEMDDLNEASKSVISVVTTKSVINNTVIPEFKPQPSKKTSEEELAESREATTDNWQILGKIQTSSSISKVHSSENLKDDSEVDDTTVSELTTESNENITEESRTKQKSSTESLIDKLDRVQSDLSSGLLTGGYHNLENNITVIKENSSEKNKDMPLNLDGKHRTTEKEILTESKKEVNTVKNILKTNILPSTTPKVIDKVLKIAKPVDISAFLPPGFKLTTTTEKIKSTTEFPTPKATKIPDISGLLKVAKPVDISAFLPPGYKPPKTPTSVEITTKSTVKNNSTTKAIKNFSNLLTQAKPVDIGGFLPPGYKPSTTSTSTTTTTVKPIETTSTSKPPLLKVTQDDVSKFLPAGYNKFKLRTTTPSSRVIETSDKQKPKKTKSSLLAQAVPTDISAFLPTGYKLRTSTTSKPSEDVDASLLPADYKPKSKNVSHLLNEAKPADINAFLPPGYKLRTTATQKSTEIIDSSLLPADYKSKKGGDSLEAKPVDISSLLPPGFKLNSSSEVETTSELSISSTTAKFKVVFPTRPNRKAKSTTPRNYNNNVAEQASPTPPTIHKGWPSRARTEFTGWPTSSTTPISIEKLLENARLHSSTTEEAEEATVITTASTTTTTTTTTTVRPTQPGICENSCDLEGTIRIVSGVKWVPEFIDSNTIEWQDLAQDVKLQLEDVFKSSKDLKDWYKTIRIDGFSEGSVLVDYVVELNDVGKTVNTQEIRTMFHESLNNLASRSGKALNEFENAKRNLTLGDYVVDPDYTDFVVKFRSVHPTVGYAEDNVLLPQWAIAVIVIGLASLLFVIIFGATVLINREKNSKKNAPSPLTQDMLDDLNKNHMDRIYDNFGASSLHNMNWNDQIYPEMSKQELPGYIHHNRNYDSWRSDWNGYAGNSYSGGSSGGERRKHHYQKDYEYDMNF